MSSKLDCPDTGSKTYWSIMNKILNKKKIPNIPPLLVNNKLVSDFHKKAELFNRHFAEQCTLNSKYKHATSFQLQNKQTIKIIRD